MQGRSFALAAILLLAAVVAGCAEKGAITDAAPGLPSVGAPTASTDAAGPASRPTWTHGDWFEMNTKVDLGFGTLADGKHKIVVGRADASGYELSATTRTLGIVDAHFNDFYVGPLDLNLNGYTGSEGGAGKPFQLFDWPLEAGKIWATDIVEDLLQGPGYVQCQFTVVEARDVEDPKGKSPGFVVQGKTAHNYYVNYTYSSAAKWFTKYEKRTPTGRLMTYLELADYGKNFTGEFHAVSKKNLYERIIVNPIWVFDTSLSPIPPADTVSVNSDFTFLQEISFLFTYRIPPSPPQPEVNGPGVVHVEVVYPDNAHREQTHQGVGDKFDFYYKDHEPYKKGTYTVGYAPAGFSGAFFGFYAFTDVVTMFTGSSHAHHGG